MQYILIIFLFSLSNPSGVNAMAHKDGYKSKAECEQAYQKLEAERPEKSTMGTAAFCVSENSLFPTF